MRRLIGINLRFSCFVFFFGEMISSIIWIVASLRAANATFFVVSDNLFTSIVMFIICRKQLTSSRNSVAIELFLSMEFWKKKWIWMVICITLVQLWRLHSLCSQINKHSSCLWFETPRHSWWRHQMETFSALLAICAGNSPVPGEFPAQRPVTRGFDVFFDLRLNKRLSKQS